MTIGYQMEKDHESKIYQSATAAAGLRLVIAGSLASILLWFSVSIIGKPIAPRGVTVRLYIAALSAPAILVAVLAIHESKRHQKYKYSYNSRKTSYFSSGYWRFTL